MCSNIEHLWNEIGGLNHHCHQQKICGKLSWSQVAVGGQSYAQWLLKHLFCSKVLFRQLLRTNWLEIMRLKVFKMNLKKTDERDSKGSIVWLFFWYCKNAFAVISFVLFSPKEIGPNAEKFFWIIWKDYESISIFWTKSHFLGLNLDCPWTAAVLRSQEAFENVDTIICPQKQKRSQYLIGLSKVALSDREIRSNYKHVN